MAACRQPGVLDAGTHIVAVAERIRPGEMAGVRGISPVPHTPPLRPRSRNFDCLLNARNFSQRNAELVHESTIGRISQIHVSNGFTPRRASHPTKLEGASDQAAADSESEGGEAPDSLDLGT